MGLYDRDYMRDEEPGYRRRLPGAPWSPTIALLVVLVVVFLAQLALELRRDFWMNENLALSLDGIMHWKLWQFLTFQFLHGGVLHIALNGITLYNFGRFMEQMIGRGRFLALYFVSGIAGGVLQIASAWMLHQPPNIPVVGASAGISGLLGAFILTCPEQRLILFPFPFPIRARTLLWIVLPLSLIGTVIPFGGVAHAAHLGGLLAGGAFIRWLWSSQRRNASPPDYSSPTGTVDLRRPSAVPKETDAPGKDDFIEREVNPILDKIAAQGIQSLTAREREILAKAGKRINKA